LVILGIGSLLAGFLPFGEWISSNGKPLHMELHLAFSITPVAVGLMGIGIAARMYQKENVLPETISTAFGALYSGAVNKFYIDEIWSGFTRGVLFNVVAKPIAWADRHLVDGLVKGTGILMERLSWKIRGLQSGKVQQYGIFFLFGIIIILSVYLFRYMA
jgi:NADH-quinone oxidoreductase subunit L